MEARPAEFWRKSNLEKGMCKGPEAWAWLEFRGEDELRKEMGGGHICRTLWASVKDWDLSWVSWGLHRWVKWSRSVVSYSLDPMDCSLPGSSVPGISQARIREWVAISFSRGSSWPRDQTQVSRTVGRCFTIWATREAQVSNRTWLYLDGPCWLLCVLGLGQGWEQMDQLGGCCNQPSKTKGFGARVWALEVVEMVGFILYFKKNQGRLPWWSNV